MVTVTTLKRFRDLQEHVYREVGQEFSTSLARAEEIDAKLPGYITYAEAAADEPDLSNLKVAELKAIATERGVTIPKNATKAKLIELLEG